MNESASRNPSPELILASLRAGAREFLRLPIIAEEFKTVVDRTSEFTSAKTGPGGKKRGRVISVFSSKGGCGTSFLAANLAVAKHASDAGRFLLHESVLRLNARAAGRAAAW